MANELSGEAMDALLGQPGSGFARIGSSSGHSGSGAGAGWVLAGAEAVVLVHRCCRPWAPVDLEGLLRERQAARAAPFDTAIVLGSDGGSSSCGGDLSASCRDSRVLATLLGLRVACEDLGLPPPHAVAENCEDQTATLALAPAARAGSSGAALAAVAAAPPPPDFVNSQAMVARCLVMNLAYPEVWHALANLLGVGADGVGGGGPAATIELLECAHLGVDGSSVAFGALQYVLAYTYDGRAVALGFSVDHEVVTCPPPGLVVGWTRRHKVIAVVRRVCV